MKIIVIHPDTEVEMELNAEQDTCNGYPCWKVAITDHEDIVLYEREGWWEIEQRDNDFSYDLVQAIGNAIKPPEKSRLAS
jgi:hypothetical protein